MKVAVRTGVARPDTVPRGAAALVRRKLLRHVGLMFGSLVVAAAVLAALLAPALAPHDPYAQELAHRLIKPFWAGGSWTHPLGTDGFGRDYLSRLLYGARVSLLIGFVAMVISGVIGSALGMVGGYFGGRADMAVTYVIAVRLSMPVVLVALAVAALVGGSLRVVVAVLGLLLWDRFAVVTRSAMQQARSLEYVAAARAVGCSTPRILLRQILPNLTPHLTVVATLEAAHAIVLEAALSFLGLGVQPPVPSWGLMVAEGKPFMFFEPWLIAIPGFALFMLILAINLIGDGVRDVTAPHAPT